VLPLAFILVELSISDAIKGVCRIFQGNIGEGIRLVEETILREEKRGIATLQICAALY
jgi:hypothetical protein